MNKLRNILVCLIAIVVLCRAASAQTRLWLVGDSTVKNGTHVQVGWGEVISKFFDTSKIHVQNRAIGGRSSRTFITEGRWDAIVAIAHPGDFVLIQLGHNDGGPINDAKARGSLHGIGDETQDVDNPVSGKHETIHTYGWYMRKIVDDSKSHGLTPIICSPVPHAPRATVAAGDLEKSDYVTWSEQVADQEKIQFVQLNGLINDKYAGLDPAQIKSQYFTPADNTHSSPAGAMLNASCVVEGIRQLKDCPLSQYLLAPTTEPATQPG